MACVAGFLRRLRFVARHGWRTEVRRYKVKCRSAGAADYVAGLLGETGRGESASEWLTLAAVVVG